MSRWVVSLIWQAYHKIVKNLFPLHICRLNGYTAEIMQHDYTQFRSNFNLATFSLMFFPLFSKVFTDILKIYELLKIKTKIPKYYPNTFLNNNHLSGSFYVQTSSDFWTIRLLTLLKMCRRGEGHCTKDKVFDYRFLKSPR